MTAAVLAISDISKIYGSGASRVAAVTRASAAFEPGTVTAIMGPSGSGKTTLLSILGLILKPTTGRVMIMEQDVTDYDEQRLPALRRTHIGFIFQSFNLFTALTVLENVMLSLQLKKTPKAEAPSQAMAALERVGLGPRAGFYPRDISGGEKQRVSIARAIAADAPIILADEPTANLDSRTGLTIIDLLHELAEERKKTVVVVTHDLRVQEHVSRVLLMEDGVLHES